MASPRRIAGVRVWWINSFINVIHELAGVCVDVTVTRSPSPPTVDSAPVTTPAKQRISNNELHRRHHKVYLLKRVIGVALEPVKLGGCNWMELSIQAHYARARTFFHFVVTLLFFNALNWFDKPHECKSMTADGLFFYSRSIDKQIKSNWKFAITIKRRQNETRVTKPSNRVDIQHLASRNYILFYIFVTCRWDKMSAWLANGTFLVANFFKRLWFVTSIIRRGRGVAWVCWRLPFTK